MIIANGKLIKPFQSKDEKENKDVPHIAKTHNQAMDLYIRSLKEK